MALNIMVLGAGAWGTALAVAAASHAGAGHQVQLWVRNAAQAAQMQATRENTRYLPGLRLPDGLQILTGVADTLPARLATQDVVVVATPMAALRETLALLRYSAAPVAWLCKGFEEPDPARPGAVGLLGHEIAAEVAPDLPIGILSGPTFAQEVARGLPSAIVAASTDVVVRERLVQAFHSPTLRVYANDDLIGVEVGGAVKNVLAIATGFCDGLQLGLNARAALITRGLAEITRLGLALGARAETFMGLSGMGDLVLTATGDLSRNRKVGLLLAQGLTQDEAVASLGHVAEGVYSARTVWQRARALGVEMPITEAVVALLDGRLKPQQAVALLMARDPAAEVH